MVPKAPLVSAIRGPTTSLGPCGDWPADRLLAGRWVSPDLSVDVLEETC